MSRSRLQEVEYFGGKMELICLNCKQIKLLSSIVLCFFIYICVVKSDIIQTIHLSNGLQNIKVNDTESKK